MIGAIEPKDISLTIPMAEKYWHRVCLMTFIAKYSLYYVMLVAIPVISLLTLIKWPEKYLIMHGIPALFGIFVWCYRIVPHCFCIIPIFHQMCYYLELRFIYVNQLLNTYSTNPKIYDLNEILKEHNRICETVKQFNKFWSIALLFDASLYVAMALLIAYLGFFSDLSFWLRIFWGSFLPMYIACFYCIFSSAASVSTEVSKFKKISIQMF